MFQKILVPLYGSDVSAGILPYVSYLAQGLDVPVALLSIVDRGTPDIPNNITSPSVVRYQERLPFAYGNYPEDRQFYTPSRPDPVSGGAESTQSQYQYDYYYKEPSEKQLETPEWLRRTAEELENAGLPVEVVIPGQGEAAEGIVRFAENYSCDLIAMASHDRNWLVQAIKGNITHDVLRSATVPVLAITPEKGQYAPGHQSPIYSLMVPLDGSPFAEAVLPYVENLAQRLKLDVTLVNVVDVRELIPAAAATLNDEAEDDIYLTPEAKEKATSDAMIYLKSIASQLEARGITPRCQLLRSPVAESIATMARETSNSMIVLASHGRSGFSRWLAGSVAEELIKETGCPVMVIPPALADGDASK